MKSPVYTHLGDHSEAIRVEFDPARISYEELLAVFWASHDPRSQVGSRQYRTALFYHDEAQKKWALETRDRLGGDICTEILPASAFYAAEDYHQKYWLRRQPDLLGEFTAIYPDADALAASTAAARVNGYLGGHGTLANLRAELDGLGLSPAGRTRLLEIVTSRTR